jgi:hypothetical protein
MSDAEKRQAQQRAVSVAACAAAIAMGGPAIGHQVELRKEEEAFRAQAAELAAELAGVSAAETEETGLLSHPWMRSVSYSLERDPRLAFDTGSARSRDEKALARLTSFRAEHLEFAESERTQLDCLAEAIYYEARSESVRGQVAVAEVVMNRVLDPRFPDTVCEVVYQGRYRTTGCQFTFTCDGALRRAPKGPPWDRARQIALHVMLGLNRPVTGEATHYHTDYVDPVWAAGMVETSDIGTHIFYRFPRTRLEWASARESLARRTSSPAPVYVSLPADPGVAAILPGDIVITPEGSATVLVTPAVEVAPAPTEPATGSTARAL